MPGYSITNLATNETYQKNLDTALRPVTLLPAPYCSQLGPGANANGNDCGAASGLMVLKAYKPETALTVDQFYAEANPGGHNESLWVGQIRAALTAHGILTDYKAGFDETLLFKCMRERKPVIALFKYARLVDNGLTQYTNFKGAHFAVIVGVDPGCVYIHDPYYDGLKGEACAYPIGIFWKAWEDAVQDSNPDRAGIFPTLGIGEALPPDPAVLYKVKITCNAQNVRSGPGENFEPPVDLYTKNRIVPIYEEKGKWGRVSPKNWIYLGAPYNTKLP